MKILILGGDGYLGWPTAMHLSAHGHDVVVVDNYLRRNICQKENVLPLFSVPTLHERTKIWESKSEKRIEVMVGDLREWIFVKELFETVKPDAIVHYAEQPSAPYSMLNRRAASLTIENNLMVTTNVIFAVKEIVPEAHIVKLGTMGEYGTPDIDIEEGWIDIFHKGRSDTFLYPRQAGSLYHTTKIMDTDLLWFYVRMHDLRVTDLMQGPVYGLITEENEGEPLLYPFFNYDEMFGTVINRFVVQAAIGFPLTVYGAGGQTRGYLDIRDTLQCIRLTIENPADKGELRIFNQFVDIFSVNQLASMVQEAGKEMDLKVSINQIDNPRKEMENHYYKPAHTGLLDLGLEPHYISKDVLMGMVETVLMYRDGIRREVILRDVKW